MAKDVIHIPIIKHQTVSDLVVCFFYYTLYSQKYVQATLAVDIKVDMSASTYLKYTNVIALAVDKLIFIISCCIIKQRVGEIHKDPDKSHSIHLNSYFVPEQVQLLLQKTDYLGYISQIYYLSTEEQIFLRCYFVYFFYVLHNL